MKNEITGLIFKHGEDDYSFWSPELTSEETNNIMSKLNVLMDNGYSVRGNAEEILEEISDNL